MRSFLLELLAGSAAVVSATRNKCMQENIKDLASLTSCGDSAAVSTCLRRIDLDQLDKIELCFFSGGCDLTDASIGAKWFVQECGIYEEAEKGDLRRRADSTSSKSTSESNTKSTTKSDTSSTTSPASTSVTTTSDSSTSSSSSSSSGTSSTLSTSTTSSSSSSSTTTTASSTSSTLVCSTTTMVSTKVCSTITTSGSSTVSCTSTETAVSTCAAGNICSTDTAGNPVCMVRDNHLTVSGLIVAIAFGVGIGGFVIALIVMYCKGQKLAKRDNAERMALLSRQSFGQETRRNDVESAQVNRAPQINISHHSDPTSEANYPLMAPVPQQDYIGRDITTSSHGQPPAPIRLHQGVSSL